MKIIDIGICVNNNDPKGVGRIRYRPYGLYVSEISKSIDYTEWDINDPFIALPFLPLNINVLPNERQSIKIIRYDVDKTTQNVEYVSGPFATPHNFGSETFTDQHKYTTYGGVIVKKLPDVMTSTGEYIDKRSAGSLAQTTDQGLYGNYGSDVILTENGVMLRGGKLINKNITNQKLSQRLKEVPLMSDKMAKITLKKFPNTFKLIPSDVTTSQIAIGTVKYLVEYSLDNILSPTTLNLYVYKIKGNGTDFFTNIFNESTFPDTTNQNIYTFISTSGITTLSYTVGSSDDASSELRQALHLIDQYDLTKFDSKYPKEDTHPFFFRPTSEFSSRITNDLESTSRQKFISGIQVRNITGGTGLVFSRQSANAPILNKTATINNLVNQNTGEQTFASVSSDLLYLLSTNSNKGPKDGIIFNELDPYEYTQSDYLSLINPNTYSMVRGDVLINLLQLMYTFLIGHVHNINDPAMHLEKLENDLREMINKMGTDLVNQSIRIN